jgi:chaperonin cofactor prefoldin
MNIVQRLKQGYKLAKTDEQKAKVKAYHKRLDYKLANMNRMLDECEKLDEQFNAIYARIQKASS